MQESVKTLKALTNTVTNYTAINNPLTLENIGMAFMRTKAASASPTTKPPPVAKPVSPIKSTSAPLLPELPPLTILIQILSTIYKTYTVSDNNEAILTSTHQTVFPQNWSLKNEIGLRVKGASLAKVDTGGRESALNGDPEVCDPDDICESVVGDAGIIGNEEKRDTEIVTPEELVPENYENEKIESKEVPESVLATSVFVVTIPEALVEAETTASESINTAETQSDTSVKNTEDVEVLKVDVVAKDQMVTNIPRCVSEEPDVLKPGPLAEPTSVTLEDTNMVIPEII